MRSTWPTTAIGRTFSWNAAERVRSEPRLGANNIPHMFQLGYVYEFPFGNGKKWATSGVSKAVLGGWQVERHLRCLQGTAVHADRFRRRVEYAGQCADAGPGEADCRQRWAWSATTAHGSTPPRLRVPRGSGSATWAGTPCRGPGVVNTDLSLFRTFKMTERFNLQFRAEAFNMSNTPHFANPSGNANSSDLRTDHVHAIGRGCIRPVARNALRLAPGLLVVNRAPHHRRRSHGDYGVLFRS